MAQLDSREGGTAGKASMKLPALSAALTLFASAAVAQAPTTQAMSCSQAQNLVAVRGAVFLYTRYASPRTSATAEFSTASPIRLIGAG